MENARKVCKHIRRIPGKYLSLYGERSEFRVVFGTKNRLQIRRKKPLVYSPNTPIDKKLSRSWLIMIQHEIFFGFLLSLLAGLD